MRDPFAVACQAQGRLTWAQTKALALLVAAQPDGMPAWSYAAPLLEVLGVDEAAQEGMYAEALEHRARLEGDTPP